MARMVNIVFGIALAAASLFELTEAVASVGKNHQALETELSSISALHSKTIAEIESSMTLEHAVKVLQSSNKTDSNVMNLLKEGLKKVGHHHKHHKHRTVSNGHAKSGYTPTDEAPKDYSGGVWKALYKINDMLLETVEKWDLEEIRCKGFERSSSQLQEEINEDLTSYIILVSSALADKNEASGKVDIHKGEGDKVENDIRSFRQEMTIELTSLNKQLTVTQSDSAVMEKILNMTQCSDTTAKTAMMQTDAELLQCTNTKTGKTYEKVNVRSAELSRQFAQMRHPKVVNLLRAAGINVGGDAHVGLALAQKADCGCSCYNGTLDVLFGAEQNNNTCNIKKPADFAFLDNCCVRGDEVQACCPVPTLAPEFTYGVETVNTSSGTSANYMDADKSEKCSLSESSKCPELRERFLNIAGGISDTITQLKRLITSTEFRKDEGLRIMQAELGYHKDVAESENEKLARAMAQLGTVRESQRMKTSLLRETINEYDAEVKEFLKYLRHELPLAEPFGKCPKYLLELDNERCALTVIRGELLNMDALPNNVTDCDTSEWVEEECSVTCGGGTRLLVRTAEIEADHGYHCPALEARTSCNEARCPLDCELSDWTGWSPCSAMCDGGVMDRIRPVEVHPTKGGTPCESSDDEQDCNNQACDKDCVLHDWTEWYASCTKVCGGGRQVRYRHVKEHEYGEMGTCAKFHDATRFQWKPCNTQPCQFDDTKSILCEAKLDIILALDGSGSLGLAGWEAIKLAGSAFAAAMGSGVNLGAMVFSSPYWYEEMEVCMGWRPAADWPQHSDCGVQWAHRMTTDTGAVAQAIRDHTADFRGTLTNIAIDYAEVELSNRGRSYANSVMVVITDGYPESYERTWAAAQKFQNVGRLLMVPVGPDFADNVWFQNLVSYPYQDNIVAPADFKELTMRSTMDTIISDFCPNIVQ